MYLFFDTETCGLPKNWKAPVTDLNNWPRMIQIAWILCDTDGNRIESDDFIIRPEGFTIPREAAAVHGISTERAIAEGVELTPVLNKFSDLIEQSDAIVAHNIGFDEKILGAEFLRKQVQNSFMRKRKLCTMLASTKYKLNKKLPDYGWRNETKTGIIENVEKIWMHPFRANQFSFTEVAPFPEMEFPIEIGKTWSGHLRIQQGWGDWENSSGNFRYKIVKQESIETKYGKIADCWKVESEANYPFGKSNLDYWYNANLGFVKMNYRNYGGQYLEIELEKVDEN